MRCITIVGASLAGLTAAEQLRELGYDGELRLVGGEPVAPYDRPPLSKQVLSGVWSPEQAALRADTHFSELNIDLRLGNWVRRLDLQQNLIEFDSDETLGHDGLIIATGAQPNIPEFAVGIPGVYALRSLADCIALKQAFLAVPRVVIVGAGFIGLEVASVARSLGLDVEIVEYRPHPLFRAVGPEIGARLTQVLNYHGVRLRFGVGVQGIVGKKRVEAVTLSDGSTLPADVVLFGIGATPCTQWLESSGLTLRNGVVCNEYCEAAPNVFAAGDVACWPDPNTGQMTRSEHWTNAIEQARVAATNLLKGRVGRKPYVATPYVWSDHFGQKLQVAGETQPSSEALILRHTDPARFAALHQLDGRLAGVVTINWPAMLVRCRNLVARRTAWEQVLEEFKKDPAVQQSAA